MNRRLFLAGSAIGASVLTVPFGRSGFLAYGAVPDAEARRMVVIFLRGAVDGLSVVVPHGDPGYYQARHRIALAPPNQAGGVLDLDGLFGLHPALAPVMPFWRQGSLGFVHASGSPDPTRSHFDAQIFMENGTPGLSGTQDGWMNRLLAHLPGPRSSTEALVFGPNIPRILSGPIEVANVPLGNAVGKPMPIDRPEITAAFAKLYSGTDSMSRAFQEGQEARRTVAADMQDEMTAADNGAPLPNGFPGDAARLAGMMRQDATIRLAFVALGGWDTHVNQGNMQGQLANHLAPLAQGLAALATGLGPAYQDTIILVMSEFGRTVHENGNGGTDHGHGNVLWLMGGPIAGGRVHGSWPGFAQTNLYQGRDLAVTTDFRAVVSSLLQRHFALADPALAEIFPGRFDGMGKMASLMRA